MTYFKSYVIINESKRYCHTMHPYDYDMWHKTPIEEYDYFFHNKT